MGSCIICGTSVDGHICDLHEEDVLFEFRGDHPEQLTTGRYYRGSVDGFAEFGVFVDIGDSVTGLLHRSELDRRLDSLDWDAGDEVYVKVKNVRDNGNIDLGWSIRQDEAEFRGTLVDDPEFDHARLAEEVNGGDEGNADGAGDAAAPQDSPDGDDDHEETTGQARVSGADVDERADRTAGAVAGGEREGGEKTSGETERARAAAGDVEAAEAEATEGETSDEPAGQAESGEETATEAETEETAEVTATAGGETVVEAETPAEGEGDQPAVVEESTDLPRVAIADLEDRVGEDVRLEGEIVDARQTSGPTVFELRDETGTVDCAAFVEAGVRAYPDVGEDDVVRLDGEVRERRGELQVETEAVVALSGEDREAVEARLENALDARARPDAVEPLAADPAIEALSEDLVDAATAIRRAVITDRPVIVRHAATADGYVAGAALERATLPLVREEHARADAEYHYFDRRPLEGGVYDMDDATRDATNMLENRDRHDEKLPLFVFVAAGGTRESLDGFELLDVYGAPRVVIDDAAADEEAVAAVETLVSPATVEAEPTTATALAANVAAHVNGDVREDLVHLPAVSFWDEVPEAYREAAGEAGYDAEAVTSLREAVALEAYYQSFEDKRELIIDLLFGDEDDISGLAANVAEQFREKLDGEVETARANLDTREVAGATIDVLDTDAFTHRFDFPPETLLLDELQRRSDADAVVGVAEDTLYVRAADVDVHAIAWELAERVPSGGVTVHSTRERSLRFLSGEREAVLDAALDVVADTV